MPGARFPTKEEIRWMQEHADDTLVPDIIAACSILSVVATVFVALRLLARRLLASYLRLYASDWLVLAAWVLFVPFIVLFGLTTWYGAGRHSIFLKDAKTLQLLTVAIEGLYAVILVLLKLSIITFYWQIFGSARVAWFQRLTYVVAFVSIALGIALLTTTCLQCIPLSRTWDPTISGTCFDYGVSATVLYVGNILTELILLTMPIPLVLNLQTSTTKKYMLLLTFSVGAGTCLISMIQLKYIGQLGQTANAPWDNAPIGLLTTAELAFGFLATCFPTYRPLYKYLSRGSKRGTTTSTDPRSKNLESAAIHAHSQTPDWRRGAKGGNEYYVKGGADRNGSEGSLAASHEGILVTDQVELVVHGRKDGFWVRVE